MKLSHWVYWIPPTSSSPFEPGFSNLDGIAVSLSWGHQPIYSMGNLFFSVCAMSLRGCFDHKPSLQTSARAIKMFMTQNLPKISLNPPNFGPLLNANIAHGTQVPRECERDSACNWGEHAAKELKSTSKHPTCRSLPYTFQIWNVTSFGAAVKALGKGPP